MVAALGTLIDELAGDPATATICTVEIRRRPGRGAPPPVGNRALHAMIDASLVEARGGQPLRPVACEFIVGGIHESIRARTWRGELHALPDLVPDLLDAVLHPYAGATVAEYASTAARNRAANGQPG